MESVIRLGRVSLEPTATPKNIQSAKENENCLILHLCYKCQAFSLVRAQRLTVYIALLFVYIEVCTKMSAAVFKRLHLEANVLSKNMAKVQQRVPNLRI